MRRLMLYSPALLLLVWAACGAADIQGQAATVIFRVTFAVTLVLHSIEEFRRD
jgi:hypothetical protein